MRNLFRQKAVRFMQFFSRNHVRETFFGSADNDFDVFCAEISRYLLAESAVEASVFQSDDNPVFFSNRIKHFAVKFSD